MIRITVGRCLLVNRPLRSIPHTVSALGMREHLLITFTPAGNMELYFLDAKANSSLAYSADFMNRYEMQWIDPSPFGKTSLRSIDATANDALDSPGS